MPRFHFCLIPPGSQAQGEEFRPWANLSYKQGSLWTIYSAGLLGRSLQIFPALSNSKQLFTALSHNSVCLNAFTFPGSCRIHRLKQYQLSQIIPPSKINQSVVAMHLFSFVLQKNLASVVTDLVFSILVKIKSNCNNGFSCTSFQHVLRFLFLLNKNSETTVSSLQFRWHYELWIHHPL